MGSAPQTANIDTIDTVRKAKLITCRFTIFFQTPCQEAAASGERVLMLGNTKSNPIGTAQIDGDAGAMQELYADAFSALEEGVALFDAELRFCFCNDRFSDLTGATPDARQGEAFQDIFLHIFSNGLLVPGEETGPAAYVQDFSNHVKAQGPSVEFRRKDGRTVSISSRKTARGGILLSVREITGEAQSDPAEGDHDDILKTIIEAYPANLLMSRLDSGEVLYRSKSFVELFGEQPSACGSWRQPESRKGFLEALKQNKRIDDFFVEGIRADGTAFPCQVSARLIDFRGETVIVCSSIDLTEAYALRDQSDRANERLRDAVEALRDGFVLYDRDHRLVFANGRYADMLGPHKHLLKPGTPMADIIGQAVGSGHIKIVRGPEGGVSGVLEELDKHRKSKVEIQVADGTQRLIKLAKLRDGGIVASVRDITDQRTTEARARAMLHDAIDAVDFGIALIDDDEKLVFANRKYREIADPAGGILQPGRPIRDIHADAIDSGLFPLPPWAPKQETLNELDQMLRQGAKGFPVPNNHGRDIVGSVYQTALQGRLFTLEDVTEQLRAERLFTDAVARLPVGVAIEDAEGRLTHCNEAFAAPFHLTPNELLELSSKERAHVLAQQLAAVSGQPVGRAAAKAFREAVAEQRSTLSPFEVIFQDGRHFLVERATTQDEGRVVVVTEFTALKQAEEEQREADMLLRTIVDACPANFMVSRIEDGKIIYCPPASRERFGDIKSTLSFFLCPEDREKYLEALLPTGSLDDYRVQFRRADGSVMQGLTAARVTDYKGEDVIVSSTRDISELLAMQEELQRQRDIAHQNEKLSALGELLAGVAHELNNPLSIIVGYAQMLEGKLSDPVLSRRVERIAQAADRSAKIVKTFLAMARQRPANIEQCSLSALAETALEVVGYGLRANGTRIQTEFDNTLPAVAGDKDQLIQVFTNLIVNAEHALAPLGEKGRLTLRTYVDRRSGHCVAEINDNGPGIPKDIQARIFEPFFTTKDVGKGTGVGLAFSHRIIDTHGGTLDVRSSAQKGTSFFVRLAPSTEADTPEDAGPSQTKAPEKLRVLVVDDEADVGELLQDMLAEAGCDATFCSSVRAAMTALDKEKFDIIISDFKMPGMTGEDFYRSLQAEKPEYIGRIGIVTGDTMSRAVTKFLSESRCPYIEKPISGQDLEGLVTQLSGGKR